MKSFKRESILKADDLNAAFQQCLQQRSHPYSRGIFSAEPAKLTYKNGVFSSSQFSLIDRNGVCWIVPASTLSCEEPATIATYLIGDESLALHVFDREVLPESSEQVFGLSYDGEIQVLADIITLDAIELISQRFKDILMDIDVPEPASSVPQHFAAWAEELKAFPPYGHTISLIPLLHRLAPREKRPQNAEEWLKWASEAVGNLREAFGRAERPGELRSRPDGNYRIYIWAGSGIIDRPTTWSQQLFRTLSERFQRERALAEVLDDGEAIRLNGNATVRLGVGGGDPSILKDLRVRS